MTFIKCPSSSSAPPQLPTLDGGIKFLKSYSATNYTHSSYTSNKTNISQTRLKFITKNQKEKKKLISSLDTATTAVKAINYKLINN